MPLLGGRGGKKGTQKKKREPRESKRRMTHNLLSTFSRRGGKGESSAPLRVKGKKRRTSYQSRGERGRERIITPLKPVPSPKLAGEKEGEEG